MIQRQGKPAFERSPEFAWVMWATLKTRSVGNKNHSDLRRGLVHEPNTKDVKVNREIEALARRNIYEGNEVSMLQEVVL